MTVMEDTVRRRDIVLRYLGDRKGWVGTDLIEGDTLITERKLNTILMWMEDSGMIRLRDTKERNIAQVQLTAFGRDIWRIRMEAVRPVEATA